ncbi:MAG: sigma-70 family RNA polymerase sigma factor [Bacteroidaceae bacterium]|nr:sigma-70 family RNA polymerase sigma factor [Bacteroidaceae bacterium]
MERNEVERLFRTHYARMYRVARSLLYDEQESEDVVSDIFEGLLHGSMALWPESEESYLLTSVRNQCLKRLRHEEVRRRTSVADAPRQSTDGNGEDDRLSEIVEYVVAHRSAQEQRIFDQRFREGLTYEEIARREGISKVAVWKHLSHILNTIRQHFNTKGL